MSQEPENKMLFDLRGRRKRVIQVIYVILALLMAGSLLVIGMPGGLNPFSSGGGVVSQDAADLAVTRAVKLQEKIKLQPNNENARIELIRARISAGQSLTEVDEETGEQTVGSNATAQYDLAAQEWDRYLKKTDSPDPSVAQLVANTLFSLSQGNTVSQFEKNIEDAARAQQYFADFAVKESKQGGASPTGPLTQLATFQFYAQDYKAGEASMKKALDSANGKAERKQTEDQLDAARKDAKRIGRTIAKAKKQAKQTGGKELENPVGGLGAGAPVGGSVQP